VRVQETSATTASNSQQEHEERTEAKDRISEEALIDVRSAEEHAQGAIKGSLNIPYDHILTEITSIPGIAKSTRILLYCRSGRRSGIAADVLGQAGFVDVSNLGSIDVAIVALQKIRHGQSGSGLNTVVQESDITTPPG